MKRSLLSNKHDEDARIADYFDVIAGTSTGSIIAAMLTAPDNEKQPSDHEKKKPFTASAIIDFSMKESGKIFPQNLHRNKQKRLSLKQRIALLALGEAMKLHGCQPDYNNYLVLSLGTGGPERPKEAPTGDWAPLIYWLIPFTGVGITPRIIDILFNSLSDMVDIYMARIFRSRDNYLRIQEYALENSLTSIDDSSPAVLDKLKKVGKKLLDDHVSIIDPETGEIKEQTETNRDALIK
ncbi:hypothetical protein L1049_016992 [Liquidambar formosana]|uniref:PNPLA domain-containing protein n=1 Tax=Liquidambar formosana TaxID=63359 RepID=A0AAP0X757_LIQFO